MCMCDLRLYPCSMPSGVPCSSPSKVETRRLSTFSWRIMLKCALGTRQVLFLSTNWLSKLTCPSTDASHRSLLQLSLNLQHGHTPLSYSKGLFLQRKVQMYKHLVKVLFPEEGEGDRSFLYLRNEPTWCGQDYFSRRCNTHGKLMSSRISIVHVAQCNRAERHRMKSHSHLQTEPFTPAQNCFGEQHNCQIYLWTFRLSQLCVPWKS